MSNQSLKIPKGLPLIIIMVVLGIIFVSRTAKTIGPGKAGVVFKMIGGVETEKPALGEGLQFIAPWNKVYEYDVRQQELFEKMKVLSSNGLDILLEVSVWYFPKKEKLGLLLKEKGQNYLETVLKPSLRSAARSVVGRYTPEQIYSSKRDIIQSEIFDETKKLLEGQYIELKGVLVRDVTLPPTIKTAIENKLKQEQESLEYEFRLEKATKEAARQKIDALGKAEANRILNASLSENILKEKGIQATVELAQSPNTKVVVVGSGKDGLPLILGN